MNDANPNQTDQVPGSEPAPQALIDAMKRLMRAEQQFGAALLGNITQFTVEGPKAMVDIAQMFATVNASALFMQFLVRKMADEFGLELADFYDGLAEEMERQAAMMKQAKAAAPKIVVPR